MIATLWQKHWTELRGVWALNIAMLSSVAILGVQMAVGVRGFMFFLGFFRARVSPCSFCRHWPRQVDGYPSASRTRSIASFHALASGPPADAFLLPNRLLSAVNRNRSGVGACDVRRRFCALGRLNAGIYRWLADSIFCSSALLS